MDGQIIEYDPSLNRGAVLGEDKRRYEFARADWHSAGPPERGAAVRFVDQAGSAAQIYRLAPAYIAPLNAGEAIEAVYRTALGRAGSDDLFAAPVGWTSFVAPVLIYVVVRVLQLLFAGDLGMIAWQGLTFLRTLVVLAVILIAMSITLAIAAGVAALVGRGVGEPERVARGVLAFVWMQAILLQHGFTVMRLLINPHDPTVIVLLLAVATILLVIGTGRVVGAGFRSGTGSGVFIVVAAGAVTWLIDKVLGGLI